MFALGFWGSLFVCYGQMVDGEEMFFVCGGLLLCPGVSIWSSLGQMTLLFVPTDGAGFVKQQFNCE